MSAATTVESNTELPHLAIVDRLQRIYLINQAMDLANKSYARIKSSNGLVEATLSQAEQLAKPVLNHLEQPLQIVDKYACQGFDKIESSVLPLITQNPQIELVRKRVEEMAQVLQTNTKQLREMLEQSMDQTKNRVDSLRKQTSEHLNSMLNVSETLIKSIDNSLNAAENALDRLLPAVNPESEPQSPSLDQLPSIEQASSTTESLRHLFQRMVRFSDKLRRRIGQHTVEKWYTTYQQSAENFQQNILQILRAQASKFPAITSVINQTTANNDSSTGTTSSKDNQAATNVTKTKSENKPKQS